MSATAAQEERARTTGPRPPQRRGVSGSELIGDGPLASSPTAAEDVCTVGRYWMEHGRILLDDANRVFLSYVQPAFLFGEEPFLDNRSLSMLFSEWLLFDFPFFDGKTPFEQFVAHPAGIGDEQRDRLGRIADSQFFSRFEILYKDGETGVCALADVRDGHRYDVRDPALCRNRRWRDGTIGLRIARSGELWEHVGQCHLYDRSPARDTAGGGPGLMRPEDAPNRPDVAHASFYLRMLRDLIGIDGPYRHTTTTFPLQP